MKTNNLIDLLAQDAPVRIRLGRLLAAAAVIGCVLSAIILATVIGIRTDLWEALHSIRVIFKISLTMLFFALSYRLVANIGKPGVRLRRYVTMLVIPAGLILAGVLLELLVVPVDLLGESLVGRFPYACLLYIPILSLAPLILFFIALRRGAPDHAGWAGAAAGLAAGGLGAAIYAWHCPDDSPLFLATWYVVAIAFVTICGFLAGKRMLAW